jgi:hypothetical protein
MSYLRRVDPSAVVLLGAAALLIPACTSILGTFEIGGTGGTGGTGTGTGTGGGTGGDPTTSTGVGSVGSGSPQGAAVLVPITGNLAHPTSVSAQAGIIAVGGSFTGHFDLNALSADCPTTAPCAFVARFDFSSSGGAKDPWIVPLHGKSPGDSVEVRGVAVDSKGNTFVGGSYSGSLTFGDSSAMPTFADGKQHAFLLSFDPTHHPANTLVNQLGGASVITSVAVDPDDNVIVGGDFTAEYLLGQCAKHTVNGGGTSSFVTKIPAGLGACLWSTPLFGPDVKIGAVASDFGGNALVTGSHTGAIAMIGGVSLPKTKSGLSDLFAVKLDSANKGADIWRVDIGATAGAAGVGIAPSKDQNDGFGVMITGSLGGSAFMDTPACKVTAEASVATSLVARLDNASGQCVWSKSFAGESAGLSVDGNGNVGVTGSFSGSTSLDGKGTLTSGPGKAAFLTKLKSAAGELVWSRGLIVANAGESIDARSVASDRSSGEWILAGTLDGTTDFGIGPPLTAAKGGFIVRLGP